MDVSVVPFGSLAFAAAMAIALFAGFVKGTVGFAMPLILISGLSSYLPAETALAGLILPTLITNFSQAFRQGWRAARDSFVQFWRMMVVTVLFIPVGAQLFDVLPQRAFLLVLGLPVAAYALALLAGMNLALKLEHRTRAEIMVGVIGGIYGGLAGVWGPPVIVLLLSLGTEKTEQVRVQGVIFLIGAMALFGAHLGTGVLNPATLPFSAALVVPALLGMFAGYAVLDRIDQRRFRRFTQALLLLAALNLIRRALMI